MVPGLIPRALIATALWLASLVYAGIHHRLGAATGGATFHAVRVVLAVGHHALACIEQQVARRGWPRW
jgi:hypothetical protein